MNRQQKRNLLKKLIKRGMKKPSAEKLIDAIDNMEVIPPDVSIVDGDKVRLNLKSITSREAYPDMTESYRSFVESNADTVFTARFEKPDACVAYLEEEPKWRFWTGDLIRAEE